MTSDPVTDSSALVRNLEVLVELESVILYIVVKLGCMRCMRCMVECTPIKIM